VNRVNRVNHHSPCEPRDPWAIRVNGAAKSAPRVNRVNRVNHHNQCEPRVNRGTTPRSRNSQKKWRGSCDPRHMA